MSYIREVDGHYITREGVNSTMGVRCPHLVVDGDKPLGESGPRCLKCREDWYPEMRQVHWDPEVNIRAHCKNCGEILYHVNRSYGEGLEPMCYAHTAPRGCPHDAYVVEGFEKNFWGSSDWLEATRIDIRDFERAKSRKNARNKDLHIEV